MDYAAGGHTRTTVRIKRASIERSRSRGFTSRTSSGGAHRSRSRHDHRGYGHSGPTASSLLPRFLQKKLGCKDIPAFDISAACAGFVYALSIADQFIRNEDVCETCWSSVSKRFRGSRTLRIATPAFCSVTVAGAVILSRADDDSKGRLLTTRIYTGLHPNGFPLHSRGRQSRTTHRRGFGCASQQSLHERQRTSSKSP